MRPNLHECTCDMDFFHDRYLTPFRMLLDVEVNRITYFNVASFKGNGAVWCIGADMGSNGWASMTREGYKRVDVETFSESRRPKESRVPVESIRSVWGSECMTR